MLGWQANFRTTEQSGSQFSRYEDALTMIDDVNRPHLRKPLESIAHRARLTGKEQRIGGGV
jgi:hypothetical protein